MLTNVPTLPIVKANEDYARYWTLGLDDSIQYMVMGQVPTPKGPMLLLAEMGHREIKLNRQLVPLDAVVSVALRMPPSDLL